MKLKEMKVPHSGPWLRTNNLDAFDDLLRASTYEQRFTREDNATGREWAEKAIEQDPEVFRWIFRAWIPLFRKCAVPVE